MEHELRILLRTTTGIANIQWGALPDASKLPAITLTIVSAPMSYNMSGADDLQRTTVQADIWTGDYLSGTVIRDAIKAISPITRTSALKNVFVDQVRAGTETSDTAKTLYRQSIDLRVFA